jgi:hypothetical protein
MFSELGIRDKNGKKIIVGDTVKVNFWDRKVLTGIVNYNSAICAFCIDAQPIYSLGRDKGTTLEVIDAPLDGAIPLKNRRKGKPS